MSTDQRLQEITGVSYRKRQLESFEYVGTRPEEWRACDIRAMNQATGEITEFKLDADYEEVKPITSRLSKEQYLELMTEISGSEWAKGICELCGHIIKYPYPIAHKEKKLYMFVGIECVDNFTFAGQEYKQKRKQFKIQLVRQLFLVWAPMAKREIWMVGKKDPNSTLLHRQYYLMLKAIEAMQADIDEVTTRQIRKIFKRAYELGLTVPDDFVPKPKE